MSTEKIGIELEVLGYADAKKQMEDISRLTSTFRGKNAKIALTIDGEERIDTVRNHIKNLRQELRALQAERDKLKRKDTSLMDDDELKAYRQQLKGLNQDIQTVQNTINRLTTASQNAGKSLKTTFNAVSSQVAHIGSAMQSVGNALTRFAMPFQNLLKGTVFGMGYNLLGQVSSGLSNGFSRYDTMHKYPRMMAEYEKANYSAQDSINELEQSVRGLPTGLNEIVETAQRYTLSMNDMEKGTKLAIATNNAFLASMATESQQYQGMLQLQDLMNGKDLTSREWMSLGTSMGKAINEIGKELGYSSDQMGTFRQELYAGNIATEDFLNALIKVGTGEGSVANLAQLSKTTWEAVSRNVGNAFARMTAGILESLDEISEQLTGKILVRAIAEDLLPQIDKMTASIKAWIKANPDKIRDFFNDLKKLNLKSLLKGYVEGIGIWLKSFQAFAKFLGGKDLAMLGRAFGRAGFFGRLLTISGGLVKGSRHIVAAIVTGIRALAETIPLMDKLKKFKFFEILFSKGGKGGDIVSGTASTGKAFGGLISLFKNVAALSGSIAMLGGAGFVAFKSFKSMLKDLGEIIDIAGDIDWNKGAVALIGLSAFFEAFAGVAYIVGKSKGLGLTLIKGSAMVGTVTAIISGFATFDTWLIKKAMDNIRDTAQGLKDTLVILKNMPKSSNLTNLKNAIDNVMEVYEVLKFNEGGKGLWSISLGKAKGFRKRIDAFNGVLEKLKDSVKNISGLSDLPDMDSARVGITALVDTIGEIYRVADEQFSDLDKGNSKSIQKTFGNLSKLFEDIDSIYEIVRLRSWTAKMGDADTEGSRTQGLLGFVKSIHTLYSSIQKEFTEKTWYGSKINTSWSKRMAEMMTNLTTMFQGIDTIYGLLRARQWNADMSSRFFGSGNRVEGVVNSVTGGKGIMGFMNNVKTLYVELARFFGSEFTVDRSDLVSTSISNLSSVFTSIDKIYALLRDREWNVNTAPKISGIKDMLNEIAKIMPSLTAMGIWNVKDVSSKIDAVTNAIKSIIALNEEAKSLDGIDLTSLGTALKELIPQVTEAAKEITKGFTENVDGSAMAKAVKDALEKAFKATNGYSDRFRVRAKSIAQSFTNTLQRELSDITISTSVRINLVSTLISGVGTIVDDVSSAIANGLSGFNVSRNSTGGMIYRAGGGSIFKSRGTDTVPAMLTPGEWVMRRRAVQMFGKQFMDRVNSLDLNGAMSALQARIGSNISSNRTSTVNNIVNNNNNARMTQNVYTNNPKFAKLRSNRVLGTGVI